MQAEPVPSAPSHRLDIAAQRELVAMVAPLLLLVMFAAMLIGERPFAIAAADKMAGAESGSMFNRLVVFGTFAAVVPLAMVRLGAVVDLLVRNILGAAIVAWSCASYLWATHPDLSLRRGLAFALVYLTLVVLAAGSRSTLAVTRALLVVFAIVTLLNIYVIVAIPAASFSPIGENGIFDNKNSAGTMAMLAVVALGAALFLRGRLWLRACIAVVYAMAWYFLIVSRSKTSIGLTVVMTVAGPALYLLLRSRPAVRLLVLAVVLGGGIGGLTLAASLGVTDTDLRLAMFGDLTFSLRTPIWEAVTHSIAERPWLGHGFGSFWETGAAINPLRSAPWSEFFMDAQVINTAHNGYLDQLLQTGIIGFALGVLAILRCFSGLWAAAIATEDRDERVALTALILVAVCLVLNNLLETYLFRTGDALGYLFFLIMLCADKARRRTVPETG